MAVSKKTLDFTNVKESSFNTKHLAPGDYPAKVMKVEDGKSNAGNEQWIFTIAITGSKGQGATFPLYCPLSEKALWKVRQLFGACGITIPKKRVALDPNKLVKRELAVTIEDDEYENKIRSRITTCFPLDDLNPDNVTDQEDEDEDEVEDDEDVEEIDTEDI